MFKKNSTLLLTILIIIFGYILIHDLLGGTLLKHADWDSYTLQAMAWRDGSISLEENYSWLEIAVYNGNYYLSFPPIPSVVILPFTFIFGDQTPSNAIILGYTILCIIVVYKILQHFNAKDGVAVFWACFVVFGSNVMFMSINGGVWFQAQILNMFFCLLAILGVVKNKRILSMAMIALAVGCRPFSLCYFPALLMYFIIQDKNSLKISWIKAFIKQWKTFILPIIICGIYMAYNYARFKNPFEFGHNYLPEFSNGDAQFGLQYLFTNLGNIFRPITFTNNMTLEYSQFNGFMFFIANPIFIIFFVEIIKDIIKKRITSLKIGIFVCFILNLFFLLIHKTFGGWQFGARYMVDLIPFTVLYFILNKDWNIKRWELIIGILAIMFNVYGALVMYIA